MMKKALQKAASASRSAVAFLVSAVLWIVALFIGGAVSIVLGVNVLLGSGAALITAGIAMLCACYLLKRAVTNG